MSSVAYFFSNETKNECVYVKDVGSYKFEMDVMAEKICHIKKWDASDKVIIMLLNTSSMVKYIYQNKQFIISNEHNEKYDSIEIEIDEDDIMECNDCGSDCYDEYDYDLDDLGDIDDIYDDRYDERDDDDGGYGYEDEFYECCDIY